MTMRQALLSFVGSSVQGSILRWLFPINALGVLIGVWVLYFERRPKGALALAVALFISAVATLFLITSVMDLVRFAR
jgi:hypothetical protein